MFSWSCCPNETIRTFFWMCLTNSLRHYVEHLVRLLIVIVLGGGKNHGESTKKRWLPAINEKGNPMAQSRPFTETRWLGLGLRPTVGKKCLGFSLFWTHPPSQSDGLMAKCDWSFVYLYPMFACLSWILVCCLLYIMGVGMKLLFPSLIMLFWRFTPCRLWWCCGLIMLNLFTSS